jgi:hypothetical protein
VPAPEYDPQLAKSRVIVASGVSRKADDGTQESCGAGTPQRLP